jgi:prefoldin subunit 5
MNWPLMLFIGLGAGLVTAWLYYRSARAVLGERIDARDRQIQEMGAQIREASSQIDILRNESSTLKAKEVR